MRIYISGPITNTPDHIVNFRAAEPTVRKFLRGEPVNPLDVPAACVPAPSLEPVFEDKVEFHCFGTMGPRHNGHTWECWMRGDIKALMDCEGILMLPGWERSRGARTERSIAEDVGLKVWILEYTGATVMFEYRQTRSRLLVEQAKHDARHDFPVMKENNNA